MTKFTRTNRWRGVLAFTLAAGALGLIANRASLLVLAGVGVVYAAYPRVTPTPRVELDLERRVSDSAPRQGQPVEVTVTVRNVGDRPLADVRIVDGVPPALAVTDGTPRHGTALRAGEAATFSYEMEAAEGRHLFEPTTVVVRDVSGAREGETTVTDETEIECSAEATSPPLRSQTVDAFGQIPASHGGTGIEFYSTREYQRGDSMRRIDWNRYAKRGELTTVEFREERAASVVVLVDARASAYRGGTDEPHAVSYGVAAAEQLLVASLDERNQVGIAALGRTECWLAPAAGRDHRVRAQTMLATHPAFSSQPPAADEEPPVDAQTTRLRERLPSNAQIVFVSPLCDDDAVAVAREFEAEGHSVSVVSPEVTEGGTTGRRLAAVERENRIRRLRQSDIPVTEWEPSSPLAAALANAEVGRA
ncbi:DUF58 domain-containing protein (plasmid) [Halorarum halophilum]|uniref:DUF58 domain-containing protein n=1 Tax=Halorarum halophilum TaxID=2743090 RepID=A0A7D5GI54_9EURY|nr:DUF58 domain-containing protein [Halobaculum halophilum]QLG29730.1 DUF58 domain-containing protein [Halobaculum halophilum]